jgi:hypothetical protein
MKGVDRRAVGSAEAEVRAGNGGPHIGFDGDGEFYAERARHCAIIGTAAPAEIDDPYEPERTQRRVVESATPIDVADTQRNVIEHCILALTRRSRF